jgi:hypothetical protein
MNDFDRILGIANAPRGAEVHRWTGPRHTACGPKSRFAFAEKACAAAGLANSKRIDLPVGHVTQESCQEIDSAFAKIILFRFSENHANDPSSRLV